MNPFEQPAPSPTSRATNVEGARGLFTLRIIELGWFVFSTLAFMLEDSLSFGSEAILSFSRVSSGVWLLLSIAMLALVIPFARGRRGTAAAGVAQAVVVLTAINLVVDLVQMLPVVGGPNLLEFAYDSAFFRVWYAAQYGMFVAVDLCFWLAITRSTKRVPQAFNPLFYVLLGAGVLIAMPRLFIPMTEYYEVLGGALGQLMELLRVGIGIGRSLLIILVLRLLVRGEGVAVAEDGSPASSPIKEGDAVPDRSRDLLIGGLWLGGGLLVTIVSFASASEGGGRYVVTTGAIAYGLVRLIRGLTR